MQQLLVLRGLPGAGKTTFAKKWVEESPKTRVRVCRDDIRRMLGPYWVPSRETLVTVFERSIVKNAILQGFSVIVDATNFRHDWENFEYNNGLTPEYKDFTDIPIEECIRRDSLRSKEEQVGEEVIRNMYNKYLKK